jgi:hypothetical protein
LQHRTAERKRGAYRRGDADAWQAQLPDDRIDDSRAVRMDELCGDVTEAQRRSADEQTQRGGGDDRENECDGSNVRAAPR